MNNINNIFPKGPILVDELKSNDILHQLINLEQLTLEVTDACNLKCRYCGYGNLYNTHDKRENLFLNFIKVKHVIDYLYEIWYHPTGRIPRTGIWRTGRKSGFHFSCT